MGAEQHQELLKKFKKVIRSWWTIDKEHRDYILCKEVYHCTPKQIDEVEEVVLQLHFDFYNSEKREEYLNTKRAEQKSNLPRKK